MTDITPVTVRITGHQLHKVNCDCGQVTTAHAPGQAACSPASYGPNLRALAVHLPAFKHVPVERAAPLIADVTGTRTSTGWTSGALAQAAGQVTESLNLIRALLTLGPVLHGDGTTTRIGVNRLWLQAACIDHLTLLDSAPRSRKGANCLRKLPGFSGTLVNDSLSPYAGYPNADHQLCGAHPIRELTAAEQDHPNQK
jgi:hypothetical protein